MLEFNGRWTQEDKNKLIEILPTLSQAEIDVVNANFYEIWGRPEQTPYLDVPYNSWDWWLAIAGRGWG